MITQGNNRNLGDPLTEPALQDKDGMSSNNPENGRGRTDGKSGVGLVHSRVNAMGNQSERKQICAVCGKSNPLEGTNSHTECNKETSTILRDGEKTETKLLHITKVSKDKPGYRFTALASLLNKEYLTSCYKELNKGRAAGADGVSVEEYGKNLSENIDGLISRMKQMSYRPQAVRRAYIPKDNGGKRALGIPAVEDKMVQKAIARILEAIFEPGFLAASYGFRKGISQHDAMSRIDKVVTAKPINYVIDADIKGFFDNVDHKWMVKFLEHRISDKNLIRLIVRFLKSGIIEECKYWETEKGTPQGGIISPILSNIYLHYVLDLWIEKKIKKECRGYIEITRYADDFIICVENKEEAYKIMKALGERLDKFGLTLSEEKTRIVRFGRTTGKEEKPNTFDFLGMTHFNDKTRQGGYKVGRKTSKKKFRVKMQAMNEWLREVRCRLSPEEIWKVMKAKLIGHYRYYGVSGNYRMIAKYNYNAIRKLFYWLNRRSQRRNINWECFRKYLKKYPLPSPKIYVNLYTLAAHK